MNVQSRLHMAFSLVNHKKTLLYGYLQTVIKRKTRLGYSRVRFAETSVVDQCDFF